MHVGITDHLGWAVAVTASDDHEVVDRRRIELVEPGQPTMPIHHHEVGLDDVELSTLVGEVAASSLRATGAALDELSAALPGPIAAISLRSWPADFPDGMDVLRTAPWQSRADAVMYRQVIAVVAQARGWQVHQFDAKQVEDQAAGLLGARADDVLKGPRARLGPPWTKDHRVALAATVVAAAG